MKILVAEDELVTQKLLTENLTQWGYTPIIAQNGLLAWKELSEPDGPQLALLDWHMPHITGFEICQKLRKREAGHYVYAVMLTNQSEKMNVIKGLEAGADDYLVKPCNIYELRVRLLNARKIVTANNHLIASLKETQRCIRELRRAKSDHEFALSVNELDLLKQITEKVTSEEMIKAFGFSPDCLSVSIENLKLKLNASNTAELSIKGKHYLATQAVG
jgi:DNA-binding response OmpR family regulator